MTERNGPVIDSLVSKLEDAQAIAAAMVENVQEENQPISHEEAVRIFRHLRPICSAINAAVYFSP
jgi:hypothetical protein